MQVFQNAGIHGILSITTRSYLATEEIGDLSPLMLRQRRSRKQG